jgi:hypothetical protein
MWFEATRAQTHATILWLIASLAASLRLPCVSKPSLGLRLVDSGVQTRQVFLHDPIAIARPVILMLRNGPRME